MGSNQSVTQIVCKSWHLYPIKTIFYRKGPLLFRPIWKAIETHLQRAGLLEPRPMSSRVNANENVWISHPSTYPNQITISSSCLYKGRYGYSGVSVKETSGAGMSHQPPRYHYSRCLQSFTFESLCLSRWTGAWAD